MKNKKTTYRQRDNDKTHGKKHYRERKQLEREGDKEVKEYANKQIQEQFRQ